MISSGTRFVVTRPAPDHEALLAELDGMGLFAIHNPAFALESEPEQAMTRRLAEITGFDLAIVTSPAAARSIAGRLAPSEIGHVRFVAPGPGTASILDAAGIRAEFPQSGGTSEHILEMPGLEEVSRMRIGIVGAPGGRGLLARELSGRGGRVQHVHVYHRAPLPPSGALVSALERNDDLVVFISSRQAFGTILDGLSDALRRRWLDARFIVSSDRLRRACADAGVRRTQSAGSAADRKMLDAAVASGWMPASGG